MLESLFTALDSIDNFLWSYLGFPAIFIVGLWLSIRCGFVQLYKFPQICSLFLGYLFKKQTNANASNAELDDQPGVHPISAFFAGLGGCVGIGNIVAITTAVQIGGPGAVFWMWVTAIVGSLIKYSEVFLGIRYRVQDGKNGYSGGPMYFLQKAFGSWASRFFCILMCLYGVEVYQFSVVTHSISQNFALNNTFVTIVLLALVIVAEIGGIKRIGGICTAIIPIFIAMYLGMGLYVLICESAFISTMFSEIFTNAFTPCGATGGFVGSTLLITISQGIRRGCYSSDVGVGYSSIIHSATRVKNPARQAALVIFDVFVDTFFVCTMSMFLVLITGEWKTATMSTCLVQDALGHYFPFMHYFMPFFLFLLGYSTIITYFTAGSQTAEYVGAKRGKIAYYLYAVGILFIFSFADASNALILMSIVQVMLLAINLAGIICLRKEVNFDFTETETETKLVTEPA